MAIKAHKNQIRKGTGSPYIVHPLAVMGILRTFGVTDEDILIAAVLHDVVEDSPIELEEIKKEFGERAADLVDQASKKEDKQIYIKTKEGAILKIGDLIHNGLTVPKNDKPMINRYIKRVEKIYKNYKHLMDLNPKLMSYLKKVLKRVKALE
jgi:(p)ppGpp synthase/HD superfamily hydrolase